MRQALPSDANGLSHKLQADMTIPTKTMPQLTVYRGFAVASCHVWSPFVNKLEARLRFAGVSYQIAMGSLQQAPRGKIPYLDIQDGGSHELLGDTGLITKRLVDDGVLLDFNADLTPTLRAQDLAIRALFEDKLSFFLARERWIDNFYTMRGGVLSSLPYIAQLLIGRLAHRAMVRTLHGQGAGRYTTEEASKFKLEVWESLNALLAESRSNTVAVAVRSQDPEAPFWVLGRSEPTEADATVYGFLAASLICDA